jgi:hypothetical protein
MGEMLDPIDEDLAAFYARLGTEEEFSKVTGPAWSGQHLP